MSVPATTRLGGQSPESHAPLAERHPGVDAAHPRADVRRGGLSPQSQSGAGEAFERVLLGQLTKTLVETSGVAPEGPYASLLPEALTDALVAGGGIGLARALDRGPLA